MIEEQIRDLSVLYLLYKMFFFPILKDILIQVLMKQMAQEAWETID